MITKREAERLCKSFLGDNSPPKLPENFAFEVRTSSQKQLLLQLLLIFKLNNYMKTSNSIFFNPRYIMNVHGDAVVSLFHLGITPPERNASNARFVRCSSLQTSLCSIHIDF